MTSPLAAYGPNATVPQFVNQANTATSIRLTTLEPTSPFDNQTLLAVNFPSNRAATALVPYEVVDSVVRLSQRDGKIVSFRLPQGSNLLSSAIADKVTQLIAWGKFDASGLTSSIAAHGAEQKLQTPSSVVSKSIDGKDLKILLTSDERTRLAAAGLQLSGGVGDYWAVGFDTNSVLVKGFEAAVGFLLKKLGVPATAIAKLQALIKKLEDLAGGPTGEVLRFELNGSFIAALSPDPEARHAAQSASGQLHIKFSPVAPNRLFGTIDFFSKVFGAIDPELGAAVTNLKNDITSDGKLKANASFRSRMLYETLVDLKSPKSAIETRIYKQGPWKLFDSRISINWYRWITANDPDVRIGRMYVPLGFPEKANAYLERLGNSGSTGSPSKIKQFFSKFSTAFAPYFSYRLGLKNGLPNNFQIVMGAGGLLLPSSQASENTKARKPFFFPGFYVSFKLSIEDVKQLVPANGGWAFPVSVNGKKQLVILPQEIIDQLQKFFGVTLPSPGEKSTDKLATGSAISFEEFVLQNMLNGVSPEFIESAKSALKYAELPLEVLNNPKLQDAIEDISTISSISGITLKVFPPAAPIATLLSAIVVFGGRNSKNEFEKFYQEQFLLNLNEPKEPGVLNQMVALFKSIQSLGEIDITNFRGIGPSPAVYGDIEAAIKSMFSLFERAIERAIAEGKLDPVAFYTALRNALNSDDITLRTLAGLFLENRTLGSGPNYIRIVVPSRTEGVQSAVVAINDFKLSNYFIQFKDKEQTQRIVPDLAEYSGIVAKKRANFAGPGLTLFGGAADKAESRIVKMLLEQPSDGTKSAVDTRFVIDLFVNSSGLSEADAIEAIGGILRRLASEKGSQFSLETIARQLSELTKSDAHSKVSSVAKALLESGLFRTVNILLNLNEKNAKALRYSDLFARPETPAIASDLVNIYINNGGSSFGVASAFLKEKKQAAFFKDESNLPPSVAALIRAYSAIFASFNSRGVLDNKAPMMRFVLAALENPGSIGKLIEEYKQLYLETISNGRNRANGFRDRAGTLISPTELARLETKVDTFVATRFLAAAKILIKSDVRTTLLSNELKAGTERAFQLGFKFETPKPPGYDYFFNNGNQTPAIELSK
jgi:hypothetical protein